MRPVGCSSSYDGGERLETEETRGEGGPADPCAWRWVWVDDADPTSTSSEHLLEDFERVFAVELVSAASSASGASDRSSSRAHHHYLYYCAIETYY